MSRALIAIVAILSIGLAAVVALRSGEPGETAPATSYACAPDNGGITLPEGFCASVFADGLGPVRHLAVRENGDLFAMIDSGRGGTGGGAVALRDADGDGAADSVARFGDVGGTGIGWFDGHVYLAPDDGIVRYRLATGALAPSGPGERIVSGLPGPGTGHAAKNVTIAPDGSMYINIGGPSNACQVSPRTPGSPGRDPCPELERRGGVWRFDARRPGQSQEEGSRFATGLRNTFALAIHPAGGGLWGVQHGRDGLHQLWSDRFTVEDQAEKPAEEMVRIAAGDDFGWPYCYYDPAARAKVLAPEYGGDGRTVGRCAAARPPAVALPAHWGPNALAFYTGTQFPERYRGGAFIAFHG